MTVKRNKAKLQYIEKYWNEVLKPETPLDPNLVKALIATESAFEKNSGIKPRKKKPAA
jgi:hypothetical protein